MSDEAESELVVYYGGARPGDGNFADVVAIDADILEVIADASSGDLNATLRN